MTFLSTPKGLILSSVLGQLLVLLSIPIVTRIVGVEVFGQYTEFLSFTLVFQLLGALRIETIFLSKDRNKLTDNQILSSLCFLSLILTIALSLISYLYFRKTVLIILIFISSYLGSLASIFTFYSLAQNQLKKVTIYRIIRPLLLVVIQLFLISFTVIDNSLEIGFTLSVILSTLMSFKIYNLLTLLSYNKFSIILKEGRRYILYSFPSDALNSIGSQLPIVLFANYFGRDIAAYYFTVNKMIMAPYALVTESLSKINMQKFKREAVEVFILHLKKLQSIQVSLFLSSYTFLLLLSDEIALFFMDEISAEFNYILCAASPLSFAVFTGVPVLALLSVSSRQKVDLIFQIVLFVARLVGICFGFYFHSFLVSLVGYFLLSSLVYFTFAHISGRGVGYDSKTMIFMGFCLLAVLVFLKIFVIDNSIVLRLFLLSVSFCVVAINIIKFFSIESKNN